MCAIAGFVHRRDLKVAAADAVQTMLTLQRHRGPDGEGIFQDEGVVLGHRRLAIIDLSPAGHQPMTDPVNGCSITFNGEIYNYVELRNELRRQGHQFAGGSDTEVLLAAYREWGKDCVTHLRGMFAFAIWDKEKQQLFAARDRFGIKPFHYVISDDWFAFASEIKALLPLLSRARPNAGLAKSYLAWNLLDHDPGSTMIESVHRLPPGCALTWNEHTGIRQSAYWEFHFSEELETPSSEWDSRIAEFRELFRQTIALHLRSDVPIGTALSGGLDSSSIACVANQHLRQTGKWREDWQHTFSACFEEKNLDERRYIHAVAKQIGCIPHFVFPSGEELVEDLQRWLWHQEEPVGGTGAYAHFRVARLAHQHGIKVLLDGQGSDEQLAGYRKFILAYIGQLMHQRRYVRAVREATAFFASPEILRTCDFAAGRRYLFKSLPEVQQLLPNEPWTESPTKMGIRTSLAQMLEADVRHFSLPVLLRYEDRNTMAFGIESRVPFVDHVLVEWTASLAADLRLSNGWTKRILRESLRGILPSVVLKRKSKLGFSTPETDWLTGPLASWLCETLSSPKHLDGMVSRRAVRNFLYDFQIGKHSKPLLDVLFRLAIFETWGNQFLSLQTSRNSYRQSATFAEAR